MNVTSDELRLALRVLLEKKPGARLGFRDLRAALGDVGLGTSYMELRLAIVAMGGRLMRPVAGPGQLNKRRRCIVGLAFRLGAWEALHDAYSKRIRDEVASWALGQT